MTPAPFPSKKGTESCGVGRRRCGRLGKVDNCQVGVFLAYAAKAGYAPLDRRPYLPEDRAGDEVRREKCHVPPGVKFQEKWQIALDLSARGLPGLPHGWITGDDEFGRASEFRAKLRLRRERYIPDAPCNTTVRDLERRRPPRKEAGVGRKREVPLRRADARARGLPESRWERLAARDGEEGPREVGAMTARVRAGQDGRIGPEGRPVAIRSAGGSGIDYALTNAGPEAPLPELVRVRRRRHRVEELSAAGDGESGPDRYEVRSWVGWHHHYDVGHGGALVLAPGTAAGRGKTPAIAVSPMRQMFARPLRHPAPTPGRSPRRPRACCGVMRSRGSTAGTRPRGRSRRGTRNGIRAEQLCKL